MHRRLHVAAVQAPPQLIESPLAAFAKEAERVLEWAPKTQLMVFPELHLFGDGDPDLQRTEALEAAAEPLDGPRMTALRQLAGDLGVWLLPGSVCERGPGGELFNTSVLLSPQGQIAGSYRKIFPWRPSEPFIPGGEFTVVDLPGIGRLGLNICYDAWFPETTRHLAWMGADAVLNVVKTTTPDREQELVLARANAIMNQVFMVSVNCGGPVGMGKSIIVDPEGGVLAEAASAESEVLAVELDLGHVDKVRKHGTIGMTRMWAQFRDHDAPIDLPLYRGAINPGTWAPRAPLTD